jgi:hypothetical protein
MGKGWPMTDLTGHGLMTRAAVGRDNLLVTHAARFAPRIPHWQLLDSDHGCGAVVTSLAECRRQKKMPGSDQCSYEHSKYDEQALELLGHPLQTQLLTRWQSSCQSGIRSGSYLLMGVTVPEGLAGREARRKIGVFGSAKAFSGARVEIDIPTKPSR